MRYISKYVCCGEGEVRRKMWAPCVLLYLSLPHPLEISDRAWSPTGSQQAPTILLSPYQSLRYSTQITGAHDNVHICSRDLNSGPAACIASILTHGAISLAPGLILNVKPTTYKSSSSWCLYFLKLNLSEKKH